MADVLCAGHICLDIIPGLLGPFAFEPGRLVEVGDAAVATGGCVSNAGLALHRLGVDVELCGKLGDDAFGRLVLDVLAREGVRSPMALTAGLQTSYTVVLNPPGEDRMFLHCPGANAEFVAADVTDAALARAKVLHLGYPPLLRRTYLNDGREVKTLFERARALGVLTSLDMTLPDRGSESGRVDWRTWLANVLPTCDLFLPSAFELAVMLDGAEPDQPVAQAFVERLAQRALDLGAGLVLVKNGEAGLYVRSSPALDHPLIRPDWRGFSRWERCFEVTAVGTTGAGDATVAGFLSGLLRGLTVEEATRVAVAVGACSVEQPDAVSGIPSWEALHNRLGGPWRRKQ